TSHERIVPSCMWSDILGMYTSLAICLVPLSPLSSRCGPAEEVILSELQHHQKGSVPAMELPT
ncbi:MAG TPA: hypothetical protein VM537_06185, partial [Anaerolineae bacterium]|nr:hypothetical protein [Anaerolineae bacterium]